MKLIQVAQRATDLGRARAFYSALLGAEPTGVFDPPGLVFFDLEGTRLLLDKAAPSALLYVSVADIDAAIDRAREFGAHVETAPHIIFTHDDDTLGPAGCQEWQAFIQDSEGNTVGLVEHRSA